MHGVNTSTLEDLNYLTSLEALGRIFFPVVMGRRAKHGEIT
jgi:hypothetical protein